MMLAMRTDKPEAELYLYEGDTLVSKIVWQAHRQLAETLHQKIRELLSDDKKNIHSLKKIGVYEGPGSFTGLRIGISVANTLAFALQVPIVGASGEDWLADCITQEGSAEPIVPKYGADPHITQQKK